MKSNAIKVNESDSVAIATQLIKKGSPAVVNGEKVVEAAENIEPGHKIALVPIAAGEDVLRYGEPIVRATCDIGRGGWVHVHNTQPVAGNLKE